MYKHSQILRGLNTVRHMLTAMAYSRVFFGAITGGITVMSGQKEPRICSVLRTCALYCSVCSFELHVLLLARVIKHILRKLLEYLMECTHA